MLVGDRGRKSTRVDAKLKTSGATKTPVAAPQIRAGAAPPGAELTLEEFARSWTKAQTDGHELLTLEYAYLTDLKHGRAGGDWKAFRAAKAKSTLKTLARIAPVRGTGITRRLT